VEADHQQERRQTQNDFEAFKRKHDDKVGQLEREYRDKCGDMKMDLQDMKKRFDDRCDEYKKQLKDFKNNNEAIEALKKAHAKELAAHVQEHNRKYNTLLQDKMDSEDALKAQAEQEKKVIHIEWDVKAKRLVEDGRRAEQEVAKAQIQKVREEFGRQINSLQGSLAERDEKIFELKRNNTSKDDIIDNMQADLDRRQRSIEELNGEIARLQDLLSSGGNAQDELGRQLQDAQARL
jgi:chromosome segregation ATPase